MGDAVECVSAKMKIGGGTAVQKGLIRTDRAIVKLR